MGQIVARPSNKRKRQIKWELKDEKASKVAQKKIKGLERLSNERPEGNPLLQWHSSNAEL